MSSEAPKSSKGPKSLIAIVVLAALAFGAQKLGIDLPFLDSLTKTSEQVGEEKPAQPRQEPRSYEGAPQETSEESNAGAVTTESPPAATKEPTGKQAKDDAAVVLASFRGRRSDVIVEVPGTVDRLLPDDNEGSRHQRFIVELSNGQTVLVAHNIDLAPRVPLEYGDKVTVKGEYEWNDRGGVLHWTHHDPKGWHEDGWVKHRGKTYK